MLADQLMSKISDLITPELKDDFENTSHNIELFMTLLDVRELSSKNKSFKKKIKEIQQKIIKRIVSLYYINLGLCP